MNPTLIIGGALGLLLLVASGFGYWQYNVAIDLREKLSASEVSRIADQKTAADVNAQNLQTIADLRESAAEDRAELTHINGKLNDISSANQVLRANVDKWRGRLDAETFKRPKVVARTARRAINNSMRRAECITDPNCDPDTGREKVTDTPKAGTSDPTSSTGANSNDTRGSSGVGSTSP